MNDVVLKKIVIIESYLNRVNDVYENNPENLSDLTKQDSIIMNIQRACEENIDLAMYLINERNLRVPKTSREAFTLFRDANIIEKVLAKTFMNIIDFRNIAVGNNQALDNHMLTTILHRDLEGLREFIKVVLSMAKRKII